MERRISKPAMLCFLFHFLLLNQAFTLKESSEDSESNSKGNCIVRDGRDGVPGHPGIPGRPGSPGRDGRDCSINWSLNRVFEMEKRLKELDSKCEFMVKTAKDMGKEMETSKKQAQQLLRILAEKKILDEDNMIQESTYDLIPTPGETFKKQPPTDFIQPTTREPATSSSVSSSSPELINTGNTDENCQKKLVFHVHDEVATRGGVNMEIFHIKENTFLAVANFHSPLDNGYNTKSFIYKMNPKTEKFEFLQALPTIGCRSITYFSDRDESYLVAANHFDGNMHALNSVIYKWNGNQFENFTVVPTSGGSAAQFFQINGESFLAFANYRNNTSVTIFSVVYKWNQGKLEVFQNLQTHGAVDCKFYRSKAGEMFLVFANYYSLKDKFNVKSVVYKWNGKRFSFVQNVEATAAIGIDLFEGIEGGVFLALASHRTAKSWHSHTNVFLWNGTAFFLFQELETSAAIKVHHFQADGKLYLTIANYFDEITSFDTHSMVYVFKENRFVKFQGIYTTGAYDLQPFTYRGFPYLAAAFRFNGETGSLKSKIYKMYNGCVAPENALP